MKMPMISQLENKDAPLKKQISSLLIIVKVICHEKTIDAT